MPYSSSVSIAHQRVLALSGYAHIQLGRNTAYMYCSGPHQHFFFLFIGNIWLYTIFIFSGTFGPHHHSSALDSEPQDP